MGSGMMATIFIVDDIVYTPPVWFNRLRYRRPMTQ